MVNIKLLSGELSLWSAITLGQGETDSANLLDRAAVMISRGERDEPTAASLRLYAVVVGQRDQASFEALLNKAADLLSGGPDGSAP